jgi:hypothetical protein
LIDADFDALGEQRRADRRRADRRAQRLRLDPGFAATLINHVSAPERLRTAGYPASPGRLRPGVAFDLKA